MKEQAIITIRTSTTEQTPELQLKPCEELCKTNGWEIIGRFKDQKSAYKETDREEFEEAKQLIKARKVQHLVCWDLDRLYRNRKLLIEFFQFCKLYGVKIHSVNQDWLENLNKIPEPFNEIMFDLMLSIMGWIGESESKKKSERTKLAIRKKKGQPTKSYKGKKWGRKSLSKNIQQEVLGLHKQGLSIREISQSVFYWDKNKNRKQISKSAVHKILTEVKKDVKS